MGPAQRLHRPHDVLRRHGRAVVKAGSLAQAVGDEGEVRGMLDGFGDEAVFGARLVEGAGHQRVVGERDEPRGIALVGIGIERIEGVGSADPYPTALRGLWIDIVEVLEVDGIFEVAEQRQAMAPLEFGGGGENRPGLPQPRGSRCKRCEKLERGTPVQSHDRAFLLNSRNLGGDIRNGNSAATDGG